MSVGGGHEDQDSGEGVLVDDVVPDKVSMSLHTQREDVHNVREQNCILRGVCRQRGGREGGREGEGRGGGGTGTQGEGNRG